MLKEADALFEEGQYATAMPLYSQLLSLNPTKPEFNYKYGATALYGDADKKEEAIKFLRYASTKNGVDTKCWYFLGRAYHLNYQFADAIHAYNKFMVLAGSKSAEELQVSRDIEDCQNGQNLLSNIKEVKVLDKKQSSADAFFRIYDLTDIGGKILVTPEALLSSLDKKKNHKSLIHFRGSGTTVYFSSYGKDGKTGLDIYSAQVLPDGSFSDPVKLGMAINSPFDEDFPFLHSDDKTFYFSSKGHSSMGGYDIFRSQMVNGAFSTPENLDFAINTPDDDLFYIADSAKKMANFASARSSKQGELHVYKVLVSSIPADITFVKGSFANKISLDNKLAKITVVDASTNKEIDVQYTDPQTGDYVLSFPRSGKYKFSVEAEKSDRVHAGVVEIPKSSGINAYLQEMELVSSAGVEKLLINNLFDQKYDGDVSALAQQLLRQKAALDVNFNAADEIEEVPVVAEEEENIALAYNAAGFGAGLSNEKVLESAKKRENDFKAKKEKITKLKLAAEARYIEAIATANTATSEAQDFIDQSNTIDEAGKGELMFKAGIAKMQAENAVREAENTKMLIDELADLELKAQEAEDRANGEFTSLESALESGDYTTAVEALKSENSIQAGIDKTSNAYNAIDKAQMSSIEARNEAQKYLDRATSMRGQADDAEARLLTKKRQAERAKGKDAKALNEEVERLTVDVEDLRSSAAKAFSQAEAIQKESFNKKQQYEILADIENEVGLPEYKSPAANQVTQKEIDELGTIAESVSELPIENNLVANYIQQNPGATSSFESDQEALAFKREYASGDDGALALNDEAVENTNSSTTPSKEDSDISSTENIPENNSATQNDSDSNTTISENERILDSDIAIEAAADLPEVNNNVITTDEAEPNEEDNLAETSLESTEDIDLDENGTNEVAAEVEEKLDDVAETFIEPETSDSTEVIIGIEGSEAVEELAEAETNDSSESLAEAETEFSNESETPFAEAEPITENIIDETAETKVDKPSNEAVSIDNQIAAEEVKITASEDWIAIIDASIADLERGIGGDDEEDLEEQLKQYQVLKNTKEKEIADSKTKILALSGANSENDEVIDPALAMASVENDLDTLSASFITRLESKIPDASIEKKYTEKIGKVDQDYMSELASIELSGLSAPELAAKRIKLNTEFTTSLTHLIDGQAVSDISQEDLLELRRIKGLEIRQDRLIQSGEMAYEPRTTKAQEYAALMGESTKVEASDKKEEQADFSGLSPEFASALQSPFSRDAVSKGYKSQLAEIESESNDDEVYADRLALNKSYLNNLQAEIQMYSAALKSEENPKNAEVIQERYQTLLAERSLIVDEIATDQKALDAALAEDATLAEAETTAETVGEVVEKEEPLEVIIAPEIEVGESKTITTPEYASEYEKMFLSEVDKINAGDESAPNKLKSLAALNSKYAMQLDSLVLELVAELDNPNSQVNRDDTQLEIQNLDAIAADMRQESDRLNTEADMVLLTALETDENEPKLDVDSETAINTVNVEDSEVIEIASIESDWTDNDQIRELKYKSLNANISLNAIKPMLETVDRKKDDARALVEKVNNTKDPVQRTEYLEDLEVVNDEIIQLENELNAEIRESNTAEIDFYRSSNEVMISKLGDLDLENDNAADITAFADEITVLNSEYTALGVRYEENGITASERSAAELQLIEKLSQLNESLNSEVERLEPEIAATELAEAETTTVQNDEPLLKTMIDNSENYTPEPGKMYIAPIHRFIEADMTEEEKAKLQSGDERLEVDYDFALSPTDEVDSELIAAETKIDKSQIDIIRSNLNQFQYLITSLRADSLRRLEMRQAAYANKMDQESFEKLAEVKRLEGMIVHEENNQVKEQLQNRADRIAAEATVNYKKSAIATFQSEKLRNLRKEQESNLASVSSKLSSKDLAEVNEVMGTKSYTVVPSDLASAEMTKRELRNRRKEEAKVEPKVAPKVEPEVVEEIELPTAVLNEPDPIEEPETEIAAIETSKPNAEFEAVSVNENLSSIDEKLLLEANGNWLNVFEVIAQKDDFSDVQESLFVKSEGSIYTESTPIPINPSLPDGLVFQVQVGAFRNSIPQDLFGEFAPVMGQELPNGITRYRAGIFKAYKSAITARNQIREKGYTDAFVVAYLNGERLTGTQANQILEQSRVSEGLTVEETMIKPLPGEETASVSAQTTIHQNTPDAEPRTDYYNDPEAAEANLVEATTGLFYTVQVGVYSKPVKLGALYNLIELNTELTASGFIRYTSGRYTSPETAELRKAEVIEKGVTDAFITAYYNGKRISVAKAQSIFEQEGMEVLSSAIVKKASKPSPTNEDDPSSNIKYVVILGSYAGDVPQSIANVFLERSDLQIRRVTAPNGVSIYASPEFHSRTEAEDFLKLSKAAGVDSAVMGKVVDGKISAVETN